MNFNGYFVCSIVEKRPNPRWFRFFSLFLPLTCRAPETQVVSGPIIYMFTMKKNMLSSFLRMAWGVALTMMSGAMCAQQLTVVGGHASFAPGEAIAIEYSGAQAGDRIFLFHNVDLLPLKEACKTTGGNGVYDIPSVLQPGDYHARLVNSTGEVTAEVNFAVCNYPLPTSGKKIFVISDPHVMSPDLVEDPTNSRYLLYMKWDKKLLPQSYEIFQACIDTIRSLKPDLVIIPGDMTKDGEVESHVAVAECLQQLAKEGIPSLVIPGNHDMENTNARRYTSNGLKVIGSVTPNEFVDIYRDFGWGPSSERDPNSLTYACDIFEGVRFIGIDDCRIPSRGDTEVNIGEYGLIHQPTLDWVLDQVDRAREAGKVVLVAIHHQLLQHYNGQGRLMASAATENGDSIARLLADHGVRVVLTGHMHMPNVSRIRGFATDESLTEISSASTITYPAQFRVLTLSDDHSRLDVDTRYIYSTSTIADLQLAAREKVGETLSKSIGDLVPRYMSTFNEMLKSFADVPEFAKVLDDVPQDPDELSDIAYKAFGETFKKVIFTIYEGNEYLKDGYQEIMTQLESDCRTACDLVFDQQSADTRAFLSYSMAIYFSEYAGDIIKSMLSDISYMGTDLADQTDDLFLSVDLQTGRSGITDMKVDSRKGMSVFGIDGTYMGNKLEGLPHGIYVVRQAGKVRKVAVR